MRRMEACCAVLFPPSLPLPMLRSLRFILFAPLLVALLASLGIVYWAHTGASDSLLAHRQILLISLVPLLAVFALIYTVLRRTSRALLAITRGLEQLASHPDAAPQLPQITHLSRHGSGEIRTMAQALLQLSHTYERQRQAEEKAFSLSFYDPLTQLPNRRMLRERLRQLPSHTPGGQGALLILDVDDFKSFNDLLGHSTGDYMLQEMAQRLAQHAPSNSLAARTSGNAFAVLLWNLKRPEAQVLALAEKINFAIQQPLAWGGKDYRFTTSLGISLFDDQLTNLDEPLKNAEAAMYVAKSQGRGKIQFYDPSIQARLQDQLQLEEDLRHALERQELHLLYQAQARAESGQAPRIVGAEALLRWQHPTRGLVSPAVFIPLAEASDLILPIGAWVLQTACRQLQAWADDPRTADLTLAVNVSARQFLQPDFVEQVRQTLAHTGIHPRRLKLELTESTVLDNVQDTIATMQALRTLGVRLSLDDFGTGYSSLQYLKRLPLDQLKIDQVFIREITTSSADAAIVKTIVAMGHALDMQVIAEGVETAEQQQALLTYGCHYFQGYLFSRPVPVGDFEALLGRV